MRPPHFVDRPPVMDWPIVRKHFATVVLVCLFHLLTVRICRAQTSFQGDFLAGQAFGTSDTWGIVAGDFNGDGKLDIATVNPNVGTLNIFLGNGDGTFNAGFTYTFTGEPNFPMSLISADVNGDGKLDLIVVNYNALNVTGGGTLSVFFGNGDGTFQHEADYVVKNHPTSVVAADFNGDGAPDLAATINDTGTVAILLNNGNGTFQPPVNYAASSGPYSLAVADFNGDRNLDLAVTNYCNTSLKAGPGGCNGSNTFYGTVSVLLGNGDGTFQTATTFPTGVAPYAIAAAALSQGGNIDLLVTDNSNGSLLVLLGNGDGTFQPPVSYPADGGSFIEGEFGSFLAVEDFNSDGNLDVVTSGLSVIEFLGNGDGTMQGAIDYYRSAPGYPYFYEAVGDFNGDGHPDVAVGFNSVFSVLLNAAGTTRQPTTTTVQTVYNGCGSTTINATVASGGQVPTGTLTLQVDGQYATSSQFGSLNSSGQSSDSVTLNTGTHTLKAIYSGDDLTQASSASAPSTVQGYSSATTVTSSQNPFIIGSILPLSFTAYVASPGPANCVTGSVTFLDGTTLLGTIPLTDLQAGIAPNLAAGTHYITASYGGAPIIASSTSPVLVQVVNYPPNVVLTPTTLSFPNTPVGQSSPVQSVTLTNTGLGPLSVNSISASANFGETNNCGTVVAAGQNCTIKATFVPQQTGVLDGAITIVDNFCPTCLPNGFGQQTVNLTGDAGQDFSLAVGSQASATVIPGQSANYSLHVSPVNGFSQSIKFGCSGELTQLTCTVSPSSVTLNGSASATVNVVVVTMSASAGLRQPMGRSPSGSSLAGWVLFCGTLGLALFTRTDSGRRVRPQLLFSMTFLCLLSIGVTMSACGGGNNSSGGVNSGGTPTGTYTLTVTGTSTSGSSTLTHTAKLTLVVQ